MIKIISQVIETEYYGKWQFIIRKETKTYLFGILIKTKLEINKHK